jgi:hypothetical protein
MKINPALSGTASVLYASYLGGSGSSGATAIALDASGNAYLYGYTDSNNFPTTSGAFQKTFGGGGIYADDAFVAKFNPALSGASSLVFSTYLGGSGSDGFVSSQSSPAIITLGVIQSDGGIAVDSAGNVYVTGGTTSTNFPTTPGAYQATSNIMINKKDTAPPSDVFVTKLNATGSALIYSTYLGGGGSKSSGGTYSGGSGIAVDASGDAYVTGWTDSTTFPTKNAIQSTNHGGMDSFVTELNPSGSGLLFSTYLGGSSDDWSESIALDTANNVYVGGWTTSSNFPTTAGAYDTTSGSGFVYKIDPPVGGSPAMPAIASTPSCTAASGGPATTNTGSPQGQKSNAQPASSQSEPLFTLIDNNPGVHATPSVLSDLLSEWQELESALPARFDALLSMGFGAYMHNDIQDTLMRDLLFTFRSAPHDV